MSKYLTHAVITLPIQVLAELDADPSALDVLQRRIHRWFTLRMAATVHTVTGHIITDVGPQ